MRRAGRVNKLVIRDVEGGAARQQEKEKRMTRGKVHGCSEGCSLM